MTAADDQIAPLLEERTVFVLREEPDLAEALDESERVVATRLLRAPEFDVERGYWEPPDMDPHRTYGLLVLDGLFLRDVRVGPAASTEVLGPGDILRPWSDPLSFNAVPPSNRWLVVQPARIAVLDEKVTALIGRLPTLSIAFSERLLRRARCMAYVLTAGHFHRVEDRLLAVLWHFASLWGRVTPDGVVLPFRFTHDHLARIVGAQRPTVTVALGRLRENGRLERRPDRLYILKGEVPQWDLAAEGAVPEAY